MPAASQHEREAAPITALDDPMRLHKLYATELLTGHSEVLGGLARTASRITGVPVSLVNLVDASHLHMAGQVGLSGELAESRTLPLSDGVCDLVVESGRPVVIDDLLAHPIVAERPGVRALGLRAYAGVPLTTRRGVTLGAFCALDTEPRAWTPEQVEGLQDLAQAAVSELELHIGRHERRTRERRFTAFMDHSPFVAALVNRNGALEYINAMFEWHFSVEPAKVMGHRLSELDLPLARVMMQRLDEVGRTGESLERTELITSPNGDERQWLLYSFPIEGDNERHVGMVAVDMTDRRRLELQLQQAQKLESIGQLAAGIAHEINTPSQYVSDNVRFVLDSFEHLRWLP